LFQNMGLMLKEGKDYELPTPVVFTETIAKPYGPGAENLAHRGFEKNLVFLSLFAWRKAQSNCKGPWLSIDSGILLSQWLICSLRYS